MIADSIKQHNRQRVMNIKEAKLKQKEAELEIAEKYPPDVDRIYQLEKEIRKLKREIK